MTIINLCKALILAILVLGLHLNQSIGVKAEIETIQPSAAFRQSALKHLTRLIQTYNISLSQAEINLVVDNCQEVLQFTIRALPLQVDQTTANYQSLIKTVKSSLNFIRDDLRQMNEDSSSIDLVLVSFNQLDSNFQTDFRAYKLSLTELLSLDVNCHYNPQAFIAGLQEVDNRRKLVEASAQQVVDYIDSDIEVALAEIQERLLVLESQI